MSTDIWNNRSRGQRNVLSAGTVTANFRIEETTMDRRIANMNSRGPGKLTLGTQLARGHDPVAYGHVRMYQPLITYGSVDKKNIGGAGSRQLSNPRTVGAVSPPVFASWNCMDVTGVKSQEDFEARFHCVGFAADNHTYKEISQEEMGVAAFVAGSISTVNTGIETWRVGDLIAWHAPPVFEAERAKFVATRKERDGITQEYPAEYFPTRLEPFDIDRDSTQALRTILKRFADSLTPGQAIPFDRLDLGSVTTMNERTALLWIRSEFLKIALGAHVLGAANPAAMLASLGLTPGAPASPAIQASLLAMLMSPLSEKKYSAIAGAGIPAAAMAHVDRYYLALPSDSYNVAVRVLHAAHSRVICRSLSFVQPSAAGVIVM